MTFNCVLLVVENIKKSHILYEDLFGLTLDMDLGENISFKEGIALHQKQHFESLVENRVDLTRSHSHELYFETDDIDKAYSQVKECLQMVGDIKEQAWMQRVFRCYDYDGHLIEVGEPMSAVVLRLSKEYDPIHIAHKIGMPLSFIQEVLA